MVKRGGFRRGAGGRARPNAGARRNRTIHKTVEGREYRIEIEPVGGELAALKVTVPDLGKTPFERGWHHTIPVSAENVERAARELEIEISKTLYAFEHTIGEKLRTSETLDELIQYDVSEIIARHGETDENVLESIREKIRENNSERSEKQERRIEERKLQGLLKDVERDIFREAESMMQAVRGLETLRGKKGLHPEIFREDKIRIGGQVIWIDSEGHLNLAYVLDFANKNQEYKILGALRAREPGENKTLHALDLPTIGTINKNKLKGVKFKI